MRTVTICGSTRFEDEMKLCMKLLTLQGILVISMSSYPSENAGNKDWFKQSEKELLDLVHLEKVSRADAVLVVDTALGDVEPIQSGKGYVGYSTSREILWAATHEIPTGFLSDFIAGAGQSIEEAMRDFSNAMIDGEILTLHAEQACEILDHAIGRQAAIQAQSDTKRDVTHAVLSYIADEDDTQFAGDGSRMIAKQTLDFLGWVVLSPEQRNAYLAMVDPNSSVPTEAGVVGG